MKRIARPFCCLLMAVLMSTTLIMPSFAAIREQADQPSVTHLEEFDGFYVKMYLRKTLSKHLTMIHSLHFAMRKSIA